MGSMYQGHTEVDVLHGCMCISAGACRLVYMCVQDYLVLKIGTCDELKKFDHLARIEVRAA
jgi:hypothetical protein